MSDGTSKKYIGQTLNRALEVAGQSIGVLLKDVGSDSLVVAETKGSTYTIAAANEGGGTVVVQSNGKYFAEPTTCVLSGSTFGGTAIMVGWIGTDMKLEFNLGNGRILTTDLVVSVETIRDAEKARKFVESACDGRIC